MQNKVPKSELNDRIQRFRSQMDHSNPGWEMAVVISKINLFYFTGTMQEGILFIPREEEAILWVRRSFERAVEESNFASIRLMESYRDPARHLGNLPDTVYLEKEIIPIGMLERFKKYLPFKHVEGADRQIGIVRSIKSDYEIQFMKQSGEIHRIVTEQLIPGLLEEGMSESEFFGKLYLTMLQEGHHGVARFGMFDTESILGQIAFGESSIYPTNFNGPGGSYGMSPAVPILGNRRRKLTSGDLVFVDIGCGVEGYHTDKTMTYMFKKAIPEHAIEVHHQCVEIQNKVASMLVPGAIPSEIYNQVINNLPKGFEKNFMGFGNRTVKFLGHGIGLTIDETPVIANGFDDPIVEGMVFAVEPKKGISGVGMVGIENTFLVSSQGGICITGDHPGLMMVS